MSICIALPQLLAGLDVQKRHGEENDREQHHRYILHRRSLSPSRLGGRFYPATSPRRTTLFEHDAPGFNTRLILANFCFEYRKDFLNKT
jgi:hypothetical protein